MKGMAAAFGSRRRYEGAQRLARLGRGPLAKAAVPGWTAMRDLPEPPKETFRDWWQKREPRPAPPRDAVVGGDAAPAGDARADRRAGRRRELRQGGHPRARPRRARALAGRARRPARLSRRRLAPHRRHRRPVLRDRRRVPRDRPSRSPPPTSPRPSRRILAGAERVGVPPALAEHGTVVDDGLSVAELDTLDAVVTGSALAIADTGTIVLDSGPGLGAPRAHARARPSRLHRRGRDGRRVGARTRSPRSPRPPPRAGRSRSSPARRRRPTSSSTASRACTARACSTCVVVGSPSVL